MTSQNDFDAAKAVSELLKGLDKDRQQRIMRWVAENLGLSPSGGPAGDGQPPALYRAAGAQVLPSAAIIAVAQGSTDIKTFVETKKPKSDIQFAAVVAYYYRFEISPDSRKDSIDAGSLQEAARLAGWRRPPKPRATLNNAKQQGYLDSAEPGSFRINSVGENLVAMTLPGSESDRPKRKAIGKKTRKPKQK
jgi:hypothetical protein